MINSNRIFWIIVFLSGSAYLTLLDWNSEQHPFFGWFLFTSLWSAFCGIGFSIIDWLTKFKP